MKKTEKTFNWLMSMCLMALAVLFGVNGSVLMAEAANLPDAGTTNSGHASEAGGAEAAGEAVLIVPLWN